MIVIKHFRHYYNERDNMRVSDLIMTHGAAGYGVYWYILERLYFTVSRRLRYTDDQIAVMAKDLRISKRKLKRIIKKMVDNNIIQLHQDHITCERVEAEAVQIAEMQDRRRKAASIAGKASAKARKRNVSVA